MKLGKHHWGPFTWEVEIDIIDCFLMPNNKRLLGRKLLKWIARNAWMIIRHEDFQASRSELSCRLESWELPNSALAMHYLIIRVDLLRNTLKLIISAAI